MKAMLLTETGSLANHPQPLHIVDIPTPVPRDDEILIRVSACGVCHTELDEIEGRLLPKLPVVPGHEVIGRIAALGTDDTQFHKGDRVGVGWIHCSSGCVDENLSSQFVATGCDVNGGYAQFMTVPARYAVPIPSSIDDYQAAPLMCAGAIGYRALKLTGIRDGDRLGLMGFGASAHLVLPLAKHLYPHSPVCVFAREAATRQFALDQGADWAGDIADAPPQLLKAIIDTTPAWKPVVESMKKLQPGGRLVINAIRKENQDKEALLTLNYHEDLWMEREVKSVANLTHADIAGLLPIAARIGLRPKVTTFPLEQANEALHSLRAGRVLGAIVLAVN
jgi:alcohol dehydrogenase, propanol-preferring